MFLNLISSLSSWSDLQNIPLWMLQSHICKTKVMITFIQIWNYFQYSLSPPFYLQLWFTHSSYYSVSNGQPISIFTPYQFCLLHIYWIHSLLSISAKLVRSNSVSHPYYYRNLLTGGHWICFSIFQYILLLTTNLTYLLINPFNLSSHWLIRKVPLKMVYKTVLITGTRLTKKPLAKL